MTTLKDTRNWQVDINDPLAIVEGVEDIIQCVYVILTTIPGSDPLRPTFGSDVYRYLDKPTNEIQPQLIYAATEAVKRWEKRIQVDKCYLENVVPGVRAIVIEAAVVASAQQIIITTKI